MVLLSILYLRNICDNFKHNLFRNYNNLEYQKHCYLILIKRKKFCTKLILSKLCVDSKREIFCENLPILIKECFQLLLSISYFITTNTPTKYYWKSIVISRAQPKSIFFIQGRVSGQGIYSFNYTYEGWQSESKVWDAVSADSSKQSKSGNSQLQLVN